MRSGLRTALQAVAERFGDLRFLVGGSTMLALLGEDVDPSDIDVMVEPDDRERVAALGGDWVVSSRRGGGASVFSSWLLDLEVAGERVEVMGGLAMRLGGVEWRLPMRPGPVIEVDGASIPLAAVGPWVVLYTVYRPARARALARWMTDEELERTATEVPAELGIEWPPATLLPPRGESDDR